MNEKKIYFDEANQLLSQKEDLKEITLQLYDDKNNGAFQVTQSLRKEKDFKKK